MTISEAHQICYDYYQKYRPDEDDFFMLTEALGFLIEETADPRYMLELGSVYYERKDFTQALKYYELASEYGNTEALTCLGYIWYYGRTGTKDYEKAFKYYSKASSLGDPNATYKMADMYKNGYYVQKDYEMYAALIEELYKKYKNDHHAPLSDIYVRLAGIRTKQGRTDDALFLYDKARKLIAASIGRNPFFGELNVMKWTTEDIYGLREFDPSDMMIYDLYYLMGDAQKECVTLRFTFEGETYEVSSHKEDGELHIKFGSSWYRTIDDFFRKATIDDMLITSIYNELFDLELV